MRAITRLKPSIAAGLLLAAAASSPAGAGPAINQFEIKDLQSSPGDFEFQSQNAWSSGQPRRQALETAPGVFAYDDNTVIRQREALEMQLGVTDWLRFRVGVEYEQGRLDDPATFGEANSFGGLQFDEVSIEGVVVFVKPKKDGIGLGLLMEYGSPVHAKDEASEFFIGPILEAHSGPWSLITNTTFVKHIGGSGEPGDSEYVRDDKLDFAYFAQLKYTVSRNWAFALEGYGTFDRIGDTGGRNEAQALLGDHDQHRAGPVAYYTFYPCPPSLTAAAEKTKAAANLGGDDDDGPKEWSVSVGSGVLFGMNPNTPDLTYKLSIEVDY